MNIVFLEAVVWVSLIPASDRVEVLKENPLVIYVQSTCWAEGLEQMLPFGEKSSSFPEL